MKSCLGICRFITRAGHQQRGTSDGGQRAAIDISIGIASRNLLPQSL